MDMAQKMGAALQVTDSLVWTKPGKESTSKPQSTAAAKTPGAPLGTNQALGQAMSSAASYNKNIQLTTGGLSQQVPPNPSANDTASNPLHMYFFQLWLLPVRGKLYY